MKIVSCTSTTTFLICFLPIVNTALAQGVSLEGTESSTAILDTSIPFAIGAREGEQTIRGSFGWPTFQEGFVEGVYFRFDPDGYARFSTSPRLDEDVFEVTCQNATTICIAKKDGLEIGLTGQGKPQIRISGITPIDKFFISDRKSELPLPNTILGPIDQRLEALLSSGGDLIIRRELETLQTLSLSGFSATVTYLRWVAQNQASFVFPRTWPAPSRQTGQNSGGLTLQNTWVNTDADPQPTSLRWNKQNTLTSARGGRRNFSGQNNNTQNEVSRNSILDPVNYETSEIGFAQQAQGRNIPADVNRFAVLAPQGSYVQPSRLVASENIATQQTLTLGIEAELSRLNQSLRNLEIKIENLSDQLFYELRSTSGRNVRQKSIALDSAYKGIREATKGSVLAPRGAEVPLSEEERLRKLVIESLLQQSKQQSELDAIQPVPTVTGEVSVKKNIVERLLEELNGRNELQNVPEQAAVEKTEEFISLSDYISKVMQREKQN